MQTWTSSTRGRRERRRERRLGSSADDPGGASTRELNLLIGTHFSCMTKAIASETSGCFQTERLREQVGPRRLLPIRAQILARGGGGQARTRGLTAASYFPSGTHTYESPGVAQHSASLREAASF